MDDYNCNYRNFLDTEIENEMKKFHNLSVLDKSNSIGKGGAFFDDINLEEYDEIFEVKKSAKNKKGNDKVKVDQEEVNKFFRDYQRNIEAEINKELESSFKPFETVADEDKERAKKLLEKSDFVRKAIEQKVVAYEEVVYFIDYYEMMALIGQKKDQTVNTLQNISDLFKEDETWVNLQRKLDKTISQTDLILKNKIDLKSLFYERKLQIEDPIVKYEKKEQENSSLSNVVKVETPSLPFKDPYRKTFTTRQKETRFEIETTSNNPNSLRSSVSSISSTKKNTPRTVELFDNKNKITNLVKVRKDRREILLATKGNKLNSRPDLFKLNLASKAKLSKEENIKEKFAELLHMPKILLESDTKMDSTKKNTIRRRIEEAVNFYKNKLN